MTRGGFSWWLGLLLCSMAHAARAQLIAVDDAYHVPFGTDLAVEAPGVLGNDTLDGEPAEDAGAWAELATGVELGTMTCPSDATFDLCPDGSFTYTPGELFQGTDGFTYRAVAGTETALATVTLTACSGGPTVFVCWQEAPYLAKLQELGYDTFQEGFEDAATWGDARAPATAPSVLGQGIIWQTNHPDPPASNEITTGPGAAVTGTWGVYDPEHGDATGTPAECDVDTPPPQCLFRDGFTGTRDVGESGLFGVGARFTGSFGPNLVMVLDEGVPVDLGLVPVGDPQFFGVIDTAGFTTFRVEEVDGKVGQIRLVFGDDFLFGTAPPDPAALFADGFESGDVSAWSRLWSDDPP